MPDFKTTFIPQKPITAQSTGRQFKKHTFDPLTFLAWIVFLVSLFAAGGLYGYRILLDRSVDAKLDDIKKAMEKIDPQVVEDLKRLDAKFKTVGALLENHVALSAVFDYLEKETLVSVGYSGFSYGGTPGGGGTLSLPGEARGFSSIALQEDLFEKQDGLVLPQFSNFDLDPKGNVNFDIESGLSNHFLSFKNYLNPDIGLFEPVSSKETNKAVAPGTTDQL